MTSKETVWYWTKEVDKHMPELPYQGRLLSSTHKIVVPQDLEYWRRAGYLCKSLLGHIGRPCVFCGYAPAEEK